jgi:hypothetical protein
VCGVTIRPPLFCHSSGLLRNNPRFLMWRAPSGVALFMTFYPLPLHVDRIMPFSPESLVSILPCDGIIIQHFLELELLP